ncbi:helix-turn-helix transcriptional regulator [Paenibacillus sp. 3LSP]|uniref:helix-turn-helix domain-containing protein n=1 Tax=Paenibacillus sp. 3LSP TaxID=2800795 RepID=UPI0028FD9DB6|nr:helix-turn-helix transcriptional regulator [Paenibacillus sp. 3LSP]MDU0330509.1 helix-turn-helix transcriptional regulator [Paenibacillus sp. 3LSP]
MSNFGERLTSLRQKHKMSQEALAEKLKVSKSSIGMYERGQREPSHETLLLIADLFDVSLDYLMGRDKGTAPKADFTRIAPTNTSKLPLLEQIFFDGFLEASNEEKEEIIRYWHEEIKKKKKVPPTEKDTDESAWDLKDK